MKKSVLFLLFASLGLRANAQAISESLWLDWMGGALSNGAIISSNVQNYAFDLFPDSTVQITNGTSYTYNPWHAAGEIFDPKSQSLVNGSTQYFLNSKTAYKFDSIALYYSYQHSITDLNIKDTLIFDFYNDSDVTTARYTATNRPVVIDSFRPKTTTSWKFKKEVKYVLKIGDTSSSFKYIVMPVGINIDASGICGYSVTFKPGYKYSVGDTLDPIVGGTVPFKKLDLFRVLVSLDFDTSTTTRDGSYNMSELSNNQDKYSTGGWDSLFVWGTAWSGNGFYPYLTDALFHITTINQPSDAGVTRILLPSGGTSCSGPRDVKVIIKNFDEDTLTSVNVTDSVYGGTATTILWTGSLAKDSTDTVDLGTYYFPTGSVFVKAWTSNPDSVKDSFAGDDTSTISFTGLALPLAANAGNQSICPGKSIAIGSTAISGDSYSWSSFPTGYSDTASNPIVSPTVTTTYYLSETISSTGCSTTSSMTVILLPLPKLNLANQKICNGSSVSIGVAAQKGATYSWTSGPSGFTSTSSNPTVSPTSTTSYYVTATNSNNCSSSDSLIVTVNPFPVANVGSSQTICSGSSAIIGSASVNGLSYSWSSSSGFSSTASNPGVSPVVNTTYYLTVTNSGNCSASDSVVVNTESVPDLAGKSQKTCSGSSVTIGDTMSGITYVWTSNSPSGFSSSAEQPVVSPTASTTYYLAASNVLGCSRSDSTVIIVSPLPSVSLDNNQSICTGNDIHIGVAGVLGITYSWTDNARNFTSKSSNPLVQPTSNTTYYLTVTSTNSHCSITDSVDVTVNNLPIVSAGNNDTLSYSTTPVLLTGFSPSGGKWEGQNVDSAGDFTPSTLGTFTITYIYTNASGCSDSATRDITVISIITGIDNTIASRFGVSIYPNPFTTNTNVEYTLDRSQDVTIEVYDMNGKTLVENTEMNQPSGKHIFTFDPSAYGSGSGMYFVKLIIGNEQVAKTVVMVK